MAERKKSSCKIGKGSELMPDIYIPPYTMTDEITNLVIDIAELTEAITVSEQLSKNSKLRRDNRIKSIHWFWQLIRIH